MNMKKIYNMPQTEMQTLNLCLSVMNVTSTLNNDAVSGTGVGPGLVVGE